MIDVFWYFASILVFFGSVYALFSWNKHVLSKKIIEDSNKLQSEFQKFQARLNKMTGQPQQTVTGGLENLGVDGIIDALGLPAILKPMARGFIENLLQHPDKIEALLSKFGINLGGETNVSQNGFK